MLDQTPIIMSAAEREDILSMHHDRIGRVLRTGLRVDDGYDTIYLSEEGRALLQSIYDAAKAHDWPLASPCDAKGRPYYWTADAHGA